MGERKEKIYEGNTMNESSLDYVGEKIKKTEVVANIAKE